MQVSLGNVKTLIHRGKAALARELVSGAKGRVLTVFGCGGDRDRKKRPLMGEAAGRGSDFVVLTSDNPRSEDPLAIINDAVVGLQKTGVRYSVEPDRRKAIALAVGEARPGDIVLLAGKGHEKVQVTREGSAPFDDLEVAVQNLELAKSERLLLCSDGLSGMIGDKQIWDIVAQSSSLQLAVESLIYTARERGGEDNITAILVEWESEEV